MSVRYLEMNARCHQKRSFLEGRFKSYFIICYQRVEGRPLDGPNFGVESQFRRNFQYRLQPQGPLESKCGKERWSNHTVHLHYLRQWTKIGHCPLANDLSRSSCS